MTRLSWALAAFAIANIATSAAGASINPKLVLGDWYGEGQPGEPEVYWIDHYGSDGSFAVEARYCTNGRSDYHVEAGSWSIHNGRLRIATEVVNGRSESRVDEYDVLAFDGRTWKDRLISSSLLPEAVGSEFTSVHVGQGFKLPGCHPTS
ncbi:MAG TPA: hypothetical protein VLV55_07095 [Rhizomicrobium sp.]|nr:hypothetical protein [Rhizomicrobium sp.]